MQRTRTVLLDLLPVDPPVPGQWLAMVSFSLGNLTKGRTGSKVIPITLDRELPSLAAAPIDVRFAIAVARFADLLTGVADNPATFGYDETIALAEGARGPDPSGERTAFVALMRKAQALRR